LQPLPESGQDELRASVLDCGKPSAALLPQGWRRKSGRGPPQSKTSRNFPAGLPN